MLPSVAGAIGAGGVACVIAVFGNTVAACVNATMAMAVACLYIFAITCLLFAADAAAASLQYCLAAGGRVPLLSIPVALLIGLYKTRARHNFMVKVVAGFVLVEAFLVIATEPIDARQPLPTIADSWRERKLAMGRGLCFLGVYASSCIGALEARLREAQPGLYTCIFST